jgi:hypothetical protein
MRVGRCGRRLGGPAIRGRRLGMRYMGRFVFWGCSLEGFQNIGIVGQTWGQGVKSNQSMFVQNIPPFKGDFWTTIVGQTQPCPKIDSWTNCWTIVGHLLLSGGRHKFLIWKRRISSSWLQ